MNKTRMALGAMALAVLAAFGAWATPVDEATARTAAERFLQTSKMAARTLPERTVATIAARGNLWVVRLAPSGQILLSGSDRATPIIGFSQNDFSEGEEDSAERAMLDAADAAVAAAEADETKGRHARWDSLLAEPAASTGKKVRKLLGTGTGTDINIEPFVDSKYNQNQPWNDLTPVTSKDSDYIWRGRSCAGCVSIADAAIYRELEWPKYPARIETVTHNLRGENFAIRFNGSVPFDWSKMSDTYSYSGDMRGKTGAEEDKRYEIGRYVLWLNQSASMSYNQGESTSTKYNSAHGSERDWYTIGQSMSASDEAVEEKVTGILEAGIPVFVGIGGHAVVADGWQKDSTTGSQVHLVYGYGGNASDKFYSLETGPAQYFWVDHYPRAKPQLDPIPRVVGNSVTLSWHFPDCYTNSLTGFVIKKKLRTSASLTDWTADFSADSTGMVSPAWVWGTYDFGEGSLALDAGDLTYGMYQFSTPLTVTASSVLSLKMRGGANTSGDANKHNIVIEICGEDGNWKELLVPECTWATWPGSWTESTKSLAEYAGQTVQLRIYKRHITYNGRVNIGDFKVTNVIPLEGNDDEQEVAATARSATLTGLTAGADYAFSVVPKFDDDQVVVAGYSVIPEASDEKIATIAGTHTIPGSGVDATEDYTTEENNTAELSIVFDDSFQITEDSQLSCDWYADCSAGAVVQLKVTFTPEGGEETQVYLTTTAKMKMGAYLDQSGDYTAPETTATPSEEEVSLAEYAGVAGTLRAFIFPTYAEYGPQYEDIANSIVKSVTVTQVHSSGEPETEALTALGMPEFTSIQYAANGGAKADLVDGYLADGSIGNSTLYVTTPVNVTKLTAVPSHVELVKDNNVHVEKVSEGNWEITFDPVIPANRDRQRMILTLNATDTNGTTIHRDVVMRMTEDKIVVKEGETWTLNDDYELTRSLVLAGGTVTANGTLAINQNGISSFTVVSNSTINGTGSLCISNSNATITFENSKSLTNSLDIESDNEETLTLTGTGTFVQGAGTTIKVYDMSVGEHVLLNLNLTSDQSTSEAIVQFGNGMASITDWKLRIDAPTDMPKGTYPLIYASTYLSKPKTIILPNLDRECSVEVKNSNTLNFVVGDPKTTQVTNTDYPVPYSWFTDMGIDKGFIDTIKNSPTSSGYKWWQCYVLGLNPMGSGTFTATLTMNGTTPVVTFEPRNTTLEADATMPITYVLQGNASTTEDNWEDTSFDNPGSSYVRFRVDVRWTNGEVKHIYSNEMDKPAATPVAQIGDTTYTSLAAAVGDAADGATVTLVNNTETTDAVTLNDKTITFMENGFAFNGTLTGNGTISVGIAPSTTTWAASKFVANGWTGTFVVGWNFSGKMMPDKYGIAGSTVKFTQAITSGYFNQDITGLASPSIAPALFFDQDVTLSDGFANESGITTFAQVGMASGKTFTTRGRNNGNETHYKFTVVKNFNGTLNIRGKDHVRIGMLATTGEHVANQPILTITKTANGDSAPAEGKVETGTGADATTNAITTSGDGKAVFATINNVSGLYYAVAKIGDSYYATYAAAVADYTDGDTIEVLDATAGDIPTGWEITDTGTRLKRILLPVLDDNASPEMVASTIANAGFVDGDVAGLVTTINEYKEFKTWADQIGAADVVASAHAADSYLLGTDALLQDGYKVTIATFDTGDTSAPMTLSVTVANGETPVEVTLQKVAALIRATKNLSDWDGEGKLTPTLDVSGGVITVTLQSPEPVMFLKLEK